MPAPLSKSELRDRVEEAIYASGFNLLYEADPGIHPFRLRVFNEEVSTSIVVYIWSLTHGGGAARPRHEYRIQMTGVELPLLVLRHHKTLLLGWHEPSGVFAGFDVRRHRFSQSRSPSIQIYLETLGEAQRNVFAFQRKGNDEIAVAFSPDLFAEYVGQQDTLHGFAGDAAALRALNLAATEEMIPARFLEALPAERRKVIRRIALKVRASDFRRRVLSAYEHHCGMCDLQLDLTEAAHIIPVKSDEGNDLTSNGIALCHLHHEAYDRALVGVDQTYRIITNEEAISRLEEKNRLDGLEGFVEALRPTIRLPRLIDNRPRPEYLRRGLELRGWI